ncbi:MAG TPA: ATP-binding cassette domain-containing protein [Candidatus Hydrogenedentes bacterium]|nr:ATP-binding cassette domain-containing protein [Candidatus Hydrogenedentota bacterium]HPG68911.1 ATP-binding cassette domain-containing protein [Candidatus Hydrogenedentota bacterium]
MSVLHMKGVCRRYVESRTGKIIEALRMETLSVEKGEIVVAVGANGSGKTTLLEVLAFLDAPSEGKVLLDGVDIWAEGRDLSARRRCPILLQKTVLFSGSVIKNVTFGLRVRGLERDETESRAWQALELVGMADLAHRRSHELSGGEQRRVALARILALDAPVLLLDEPTAGLDHDSRAVMMKLIPELNRARGTTIILATHDRGEMEPLAHKVLCLEDGVVV